MFNYPVILPQNTTYSLLGITPEAYTDDITDAKNELAREFNATKKMLEKRISLVQNNVPGLQVKRELLRNFMKDDMLRKSRESEYRKLLDEIKLLEKEAQKTDPEFNELERKLIEVNQKITNLNVIKLESDEDRKKHDENLPACTILKMEKFQPEILTDARTRLFFIRKSLSDFFEMDKSVSCYHPSDFTRSNFYSDYEPNNIIDTDHAQTEAKTTGKK